MAHDEMTVGDMLAFLEPLRRRRKVRLKINHRAELFRVTRLTLKQRGRDGMVVIEVEKDDG